MPILEGVVGSARMLEFNGIAYKREEPWVINDQTSGEMEVSETSDGADESESENQDPQSPPPSPRPRPKTPQPSPVARRNRSGVVRKDKNQVRTKSVPNRYSKRIRKENARDEYMAKMIQRPLSASFVASSEGTLQKEIRSRTLQLTSSGDNSLDMEVFKNPLPPSAGLKALMIGDAPSAALAIKTSPQQRSVKDSSFDESESDMSERGLSRQAKISGQYLLLGGPLKWDVQEAMFEGRPWPLSSLQKNVPVTFEKEGEKIVGGSTPSGKFSVYSYIPPNFQRGIYLNVRFVHANEKDGVMFITCEEKLKRQVYAILDAIHAEKYGVA